jgi:hypothetical protein
MFLYKTSSFHGEQKYWNILVQPEASFRDKSNILEACSKPALREGKGTDHPTRCHWRHWGGSNGTAILMLKLGVKLGCEQHHALVTLPLERRTQHQLYKRLGGPWGQSGWVQKILPPNLEPSSPLRQPNKAFLCMLIRCHTQLGIKPLYLMNMQTAEWLLSPAHTAWVSIISPSN